MDGSAWILVAVTLEGCNHCKTIHETWMSSINPTLSREFPGITPYNIHLHSNREPIDSKLWPADVDRHVKAFPTVMLIPKWEWIQAKQNSSYRFTQARVLPDEYVSGLSGPTITDIVKWAKMNIQPQQYIPPPQLPIVNPAQPQYILPTPTLPMTTTPYVYQSELYPAHPAPVHLPSIPQQYGGSSSAFPLLP